MTWHMQGDCHISDQPQPRLLGPKNVRKGDSNSKPSNITMESLPLRHLVLRVIVGDVCIYIFILFLAFFIGPQTKPKNGGAMVIRTHFYLFEYFEVAGLSSLLVPPDARTQPRSRFSSPPSRFSSVSS